MKLILLQKALVEPTTKNEISGWLSKYKHGNYMNTENSTANETHEFAFNLLQKLVLRDLNENVAFQNFSIYYIWKNIKNQK